MLHGMNIFLLKLRARFSSARCAILFEEGSAECVKGSISRGLLTSMIEIAADKDIRRGLVTVVDGGEGSSLHFRGDFDEAARQRIRNVWFSMPERRILRS